MCLKNNEIKRVWENFIQWCTRRSYCLHSLTWKLNNRNYFWLHSSTVTRYGLTWTFGSLVSKESSIWNSMTPLSKSKLTTRKKRSERLTKVLSQQVVSYLLQSRLDLVVLENSKALYSAKTLTWTKSKKKRQNLESHQTLKLQPILHLLENDLKTFSLHKRNQQRKSHKH